jgi:hypothetical protein
MERMKILAAGLVGFVVVLSSVAALATDADRPECLTNTETVYLLKRGFAALDVTQVEVVRTFAAECRIPVPEGPGALGQVPDNTLRCKPHFAATAALYEQTDLRGSRASQAVFRCTMAYAETVSDHDRSLLWLTTFGQGDPLSRPVREAEDALQRAVEENGRLHDLLVEALPVSQ